MSKKIISLIPDTIKSPINRVLFDNIFQKFFNSKNQTNTSINVGLNRDDFNITPTLNIDSNISQYQPIISVNNNDYSFYDILSLLQQNEYNIGFDTDFHNNGMDVWGSCTIKSLKLPINTDKFVHYADYCWIGDTSPNYVVIRNGFVQQKEIEINNARLINNNALVAILQSEITNNINSTDPNGLYDHPSIGFDAYNFDSVLTSSSSATNTNWELNNRWIHKDDLEVGAQYQIATMPIIEYSNKLELVRWLKVNHAWKYRSSPTADWIDVAEKPSNDEINSGQREFVTLYSYEKVNNNEKKVFFATGTIPLVNGSKIILKGSDYRWTVSGSIQLDVSGLSFVNILEDNFRYFRFDDSKQLVILETYDVLDVTNTGINTLVTIKGDMSSFISSSGSFSILNFFNEFAQKLDYISYVISSGNTIFTIDPLSTIPTNDLNGRASSRYLTSKNDEWSGFFNQWCYNGIKNSIVTDDQTENTLSSILINKTTLNEVVDVIELGTLLPKSNLLIKVTINNIPVYNFDFGNYSGSVFTEKTDDYGLINSIKLHDPIIVTVPLTIKINVAAQSVTDIGKENKLVRTNTTIKSINNVTLIEYQLFNQAQTKFNLYPLFKQYTLSGTPQLMETGTSIFKHKIDTTGTYVKELHKTIAVNEKNEIMFDIDISKNNIHTMYKIAGLYKHLWSNNTTSTVTLEKVDSNGYLPSSSFYNSSIQQFPAIPKYLYGNINNNTFTTVSRSILSSHFDTILSLNNGPLRVLDDVNYIDNNESRLNIFDTIFPYITNIITNNKNLDVVIEAHKQLRLSYISIFLTNSFYVVDADSLTNINDWYLKIKEQILKFDSLKINDNQLNHPLTPSMISKSFLTNPMVVDKFILSHDGILINYDLLYGLFVNKMRQQSQYRLTAPLTPTLNQVYYDDLNFYVYNGSTWDSFSIQQKILDIMLLLETELYSISNSINSPYLNNILNNTHFVDCQQNMYLKFTNSIGNKYPYSNRNEYDLSNSFTWNYLSIIDLVNVNSPLVGTPIITSSLWGASYKEIYNKLFGTPYPNIEPWKLQGYFVKPSWWDTNYKDFTYIRLWNSTMWFNILNGIVPSGELLPDGVTISTGSSGSCAQYVFVPVNTSASAISGVQPDELLPPFRSTIDALTTNVLISNINFLNISLTNNAEDIYGYGSLSEWNWKEQITYSYDLLLCYFKNDPRNIFKRRNTLLIDGVEFKDERLITQDVLRDDNVNFLYELYKKYGNFYNKLIDLSEFNLIQSSMSILPGSYINKDAINVRNVNSDLLTTKRKLNQYNIIKPVTNFKISIQNIDNTKRSDLLHNCSFSIDSVIPSHIPSVNIFKSLYSKVTKINDTTVSIDANVYANLITGAKIIVTWDGYVPDEFVEQNDFYVIKRGSNTISLCRSITEIETTNYISFPNQYPYDIYVGVLSKQFNVLQKQTVQLDFNLYSLIYNQHETVSLPYIVNGIQELINFLNGYMLKLNNDGIFETYFLNQTFNETYNRIENFQLSLEILISTIYNDKTNRSLFFGNDYYCNIFKNTIHVNTDKQLLSLVHDEQQKDLSLLYDENSDNISTSNIIVFRTNPILIETSVQIGGAILYLATSQDIIKLNNNTFTLDDKNYPNSLFLTNGMLSSTDGFIDIDGTYEYNFEELTKGFKNIFTLHKTTPLFKTLSQQQLGYQPFSNNSLYGLSDDGGFKLWKESLSQKGSYENLIPFETGFTQSITTQALVNSYQFSFGEKFIFDYKQVDFQRKRYLLQNSKYSFNTLETSIEKEYIDTFIQNKNLNISTLSSDNIFVVNNGNDFILKATMNIDDPIIKFSIPRFTTTTMSYVINYNTDISKVEVFVNDIKTSFTYVKNTYDFTINCIIDDQITNEIIIVLPTDTTIEKYTHIDPFHITFDMENILLSTNINVSLYIRDIKTPNVLLTETSKTALKKFEIIDVARNLIPYVDFIDSSDPMLSFYNVIDNQPISNQYSRCLQFINKTWYKSSFLYKPYNNSFFDEDFSIRNYNKSYIDDDGVYQLIDTEIPPSIWHEIAETSTGGLINGIPLHKIQTRSRASESLPWDPWITKNIEHERIITVNTTVTITPSIGNPNDILQIFVNGEFQQLEFYNNSITINVGQPLTTNIIDIFITPIKKDNEDLIEYEYLYNYYIYTQSGAERFVYWVKDFKDNSTNNAFILNKEIKDNNTNMFGVIKNNIVVFNKDYRWQQPSVLLHNNKFIFDVWSQHTISNNTTKMSRLLWNKIIFSAYSQNRDVNKASKDGVWVVWEELVDQINTLLINNIELLIPYNIEDVILNINSTYDEINSLYDILSSQMINIIIYYITKQLPFDVSDYIIFTSMCEFIAVETV